MSFWTRMGDGRASSSRRRVQLFGSWRSEALFRKLGCPDSSTSMSLKATRWSWPALRSSRLICSICFHSIFLVSSCWTFLEMSFIASRSPLSTFGVITFFSSFTGFESRSAAKWFRPSCISRLERRCGAHCEAISLCPFSIFWWYSLSRVCTRTVFTNALCASESVCCELSRSMCSMSGASVPSRGPCHSFQVLGPACTGLFQLFSLGRVE
mmetsp:Transcript_75983/g.214894  ORF Transcript_75983/g.214894 Transcript_75983/m.214894 type:complete len:211 (+) Transcript_75983:597-1229(+)